MIVLNVIGESITGSFNGKSFGVPFDKEVYQQMVSLQKEANEAETVEDVKKVLEKFEPLTVVDFKQTIEGASPYLHFNKHTGETFLMFNNVISNVPMPKGFVDRLNESIEKGIDIEPMVKFWVRTLRNPKLTPKKLDRIINYINSTYLDREYANELMEKEGVSLEVANERATRRQVPITNEGLLQTYKVSNEKTKKYDSKTGELVDRYEVEFDEETGLKTYNKPKFAEELVFEPAVMGTNGDEFFCGNKLGHIIKVGEIHKLESWDQVNCNDGISCVKGLHVGNLDYIRGYQHSGTVTHNVFVDPMYIGAVPDDKSGAIRCKEYMVYDTFAGPTKSLYRSSDYAAKTDKEWDSMMKEAVKANKEFMDQVAQDAKESDERLQALSF